MKGLSNSQIQIIKDVLKTQPSINEAILYGSRATGTFRRTSDIDLALKGKIKKQEMSYVSEQLNNIVLIPLFFDVLNLNTLSNETLKKEIKTKGVSIYRRETHAL